MYVSNLDLPTDMMLRRMLLGAPKWAFRDLRRELARAVLTLVIVEGVVVSNVSVAVLGSKLMELCALQNEAIRLERSVLARGPRVYPANHCQA